jgi:branched-chain amino acid transport system substrate-binding protein
MMTYANTNHILLLAGGNSHELAVPGDFVFRVLPTGLTMGKCIAALLRELGIKYYIYVWRGDAYGDSLAKAVRDWCAKFGIGMDEGIRYDPNAVEFSAEASILNTKVQQAVANYGADKVAWGLLSFEEGKAFFKALGQYNPVSWGVKMVESGGMCLTDWALEPSIADVNYRGNYTHSDFRPSVSARTEEVQTKIKAKIGREADIYGLIGYDEVWILTLALQAAGKYDADAVKAQLPYIFNNYMSIIGWAPLDENGDKSAVTFGVYRILKVDDAYKWAQIGTYDMTLDQVSWLPQPVIIG